MRRSEYLFLSFYALHNKTTKAIEDYIKTKSLKAKKKANKLNEAEMQVYHRLCEALEEEKLEVA